MSHIFHLPPKKSDCAAVISKVPPSVDFSGFMNEAAE